jgi:hypothetical protein
MRKSKYGYILLALLVATGFAGTITPSTISGKERNYAVNLMKDTKAGVFKSVKGLSRAQLDFKAAPGKWSVRECSFHIALSEKNLWDALENSLKQPANAEKRCEIKLTDEQWVRMMEDRNCNIKTSRTLEAKSAHWKNLDEALGYFKNLRNEHIKYVKNTTEDLRNHVVEMPFGTLDCYQLCLVVAAYSRRHTQQLNEMKTESDFPKE